MINERFYDARLGIRTVYVIHVTPYGSYGMLFPGIFYL